jgi:hypothetical protein
MSIIRRGYNASRLKSQLKMAVTRLAVATNKKSALMGQAKREVVQLLGEHPRLELAMIRAESLMRDESTIEAYDVLGLKCELLSERIGLISSSKSCPEDLVECISSVMWSSSVWDIKELVEVRRQFRYKYGKAFEESALRSGATLQRVANGGLSYLQPSSYEVMAYLENIATAHGLAWRPTRAEVPPPAAEVMRNTTSARAGGEEERSAHHRRGGKDHLGQYIIQHASAPPMPHIVVGTATRTTAMWEGRPSKFKDEDDIQEGDIVVTPIAQRYFPGACATPPAPSVSNDDDDDGPGEAAAGIYGVRLDDAVEEPAPPRKTEDDDNFCVLCLESKKEVILMPCKHMCLCKGCAAERLFKALNECPMCRAKVEDSMDVYW